MGKKEDREEEDDLMDVARMVDAHRRGDADTYDAIKDRRRDSGKDRR
jgi:hypothetical protein